MWTETRTSEPPTALIAEDEPLLAAELKEALQALWPDLQVKAVSGRNQESNRMVRSGAHGRTLVDRRRNGPWEPPLAVRYTSPSTMSQRANGAVQRLRTARDTFTATCHGNPI